MVSITHDEIQCETTSLAKWVAELARKPRRRSVIQALALADRAVSVGAAAQECLFHCPAGAEVEPPCLGKTISEAHGMAHDFRVLSSALWPFAPLVRKKLLRAARAWEAVAEDAEDIRDLVASRADPSPGIPLEQLISELGLCPTP